MIAGGLGGFGRPRYHSIEKIASRINFGLRLIAIYFHFDLKSRDLNHFYAARFRSRQAEGERKIR